MLRGIVIPAAFAALVVGGVACSDDDDDGGGSEEDQAAVEAAINEFIRADSEADGEAYVAAVTEDFFENSFAGLFTAEMVTQTPEEFLGNPAPEVGEIEVDGDTATVHATDPGDGPWSVYVKADLVKEGDAWLVDSIGPDEAQDAPEGAKEVEVSMIDFGYEFEEGDFVSGEPLLIKGTNEGEQPHIIVLANIPEDANVEELLSSPEEPEGVTTVADSTFYPAGSSGDIYIQEGLEAGRYVMVCFLPDVEQGLEGAPHFTMGMLADFTVE